MDHDDVFMHYHIGPFIGSGKFGSVIQLIKHHEHSPVQLRALKLVPIKFRQMVKQEYQLVQDLTQDCPHVIRYYMITENLGPALKDYIGLMMDYVSDTCLSSLTGKINHIILKRYFQQMIQTLCCLHDNNVVHRDLKSQNVMIKDHELVVIDFGASVSMKHNLSNIRQKNGTLSHYPPELIMWHQLRNDKTDLELFEIAKKAEIWTIGVMFYRLITGRKPFSGQTRHETMQNILDYNYRPLSPITSIHQLINQCLTYKYTKRPSAKELLNQICPNLLDLLPHTLDKLT